MAWDWLCKLLPAILNVAYLSGLDHVKPNRLFVPPLSLFEGLFFTADLSDYGKVQSVVLFIFAI